MPPKIGLGVKLQQMSIPFEELAAKTQKCEELGYDSVWLIDHLLPIGGQPLTTPILESWTTLTALAVRTSRIRLGTLATCNLFRYPSVLAKMASTFDVISGGRLEFGIGAGWFEEEFRAHGMAFPKFSERAARLREAVRLIRLMWTEERASFQGKYYSIKEAINNPKPIQKPCPPVWVGGQGEKFILPVTAEVADWTNLTWLAPEECRAKLLKLDEYCIEQGRRPEDIRRSLQNHLYIAPTEGQLEGLMERAAKSRGSSVEELVRRNRPIYGTPEGCIEQIQKYVDIGITYFVLIFPGAIDSSPLELFIDRVAPSFQ